MQPLPVPPAGDPGFTLEEMKQFVIEHFENFVNRKKAEVARQNLSADFLDHDEPSGPQVGPEAAIEMMTELYKKWPDLHVTVEDILAERDKVMVRNTWRATDAASGQKIEFHGFVLWRFANRRIVERWATVTAPRAV
ncbi:putative ester cyclase [Paraburkholderia youngii]|uniref:Ester cyclase n=1 Tax=Paraburkholderia youngii TaxID=2782701 RepID=A0A7W8P6D0_9BURK|nr:ester cyclase [Paraburkholderia youngii]MBB5405271.1 putative ester cyclase [Paraburkholderia youngii]NVI07976.1 ester cyclase [Paraburkholderia youngii]